MNEPKALDGLRAISRDGEAYRFMLGEADAAVLLLSETIEDCNAAACQLFGISREDFIGRSPLEFAPPQQPDGSDSDASARQRLASALAGLPQWFNWQYRHRDGAPIDSLVHVEALRVDGLRRVLIRIRDVSRLERAEAALARTEGLLQQILDNTTTAIVFAKDLANRYLFTNRAFQRIAGVPAEGAVGKTTHELMPAEVADELKRNDDRVVAARETILVEEQVRVGDQTRILLTNKFPLLDARGEPYGICGIAADITERKHTENALSRAALAVSSAGGERVFEVLMRSIASILGMEFAFIALRLPDNPERLRTLALYEDGILRPQVEYGLSGTPCSDVVGKSFKLVESGIRHKYPGDPDFKMKGVESYAGTPLSDAAGTSIGLLSVASRRPISNPARVEAVLRIFAARAMAELERRRAEEATRAGEAQYRAIFDASVDGMALLDELGWIVDANPAFCALFGYSREEVLALDSKTLVPKESRAICLEVLATANANSVSQGECHGRRRDGTAFDMELRGVAMTYQGRPHRLAIVRDITERKEREEALRASEEQYREIFTASEDALVLWDSSLKRVDVNPAYERIFGWSRDEVIGNAFRQRPLSPEYTERRLELVRRALAGEASNVEVESVRKNGEHFHADLRNIPIRYRGEPHVLAIVRDITERKRAEAAIRASEEQYRAIFDASLDALVLRDENFRIVDVNPAFLAMTGRPREFFIGREHIISRPDDGDSYRRDVARLKAGEPIQVETTGLRPDGSKFEIEVRGVPMHYQGKPHLLFVARDISQRKQRDAALRMSEEQYRAVFNASLDALVLRDEEFHIVDVNPSYEHMSGYRRDEVLGKDYVVANPPAVNLRVKALHERALAGETIRLETQMVRRDGSWIDIELSGVRTVYQGRPHVLYSGRDVTERTRAVSALQASEEQYRAIFNAAADSMVLRDADFRIVDVNPAYEAMSGRTRAEALGRQEITMTSPELHERIRGLHAQALAGTPVQWEGEAQRRDGEAFYIETRGVPIQYKGQPHVLYVGRDITERKRAEIERAALEGQLRQAQKMEAIGQLTGGIAHDFNNILTGIMGYLVLAGERPATFEDPRLARHLEQARLGAQRARDLIQQMLMFSRGRRGSAHPVALGPLVAEAAALLRSSLPATLELRTELDKGLPEVRIDPVQFEQVLLNLCINARDAMEGAGTVRVHARLADASGHWCASCKQKLEGRFVEIAVEDSGHGIPPEVLERMFEPFFSTKEVGRGSGMGLASVHGIVHEHGGHIVVDSIPGRGTTFRVELPALEGAAGASVEGRATAQRPAAGQLRGRVLLVDDERMVTEFMSELLESWGLKVKVKRNPLEAEEWFTRNAERVHAVVTDQTMPKMTGLELARRLIARRPGLPVILYTGYAEGISEAQLAASGVRVLMRKPIEPTELRAKLAELLGAPAPAPAPARKKPAGAKAAAKTPARKAPAGKTRTRRAKSVTSVTAARASARRTR
ncbi:MAG: PAS domain-containing hybrid sensor histidine kinase/response regulator [Burkholderiales bacterium]